MTIATEPKAKSRIRTKRVRPSKSELRVVLDDITRDRIVAEFKRSGPNVVASFVGCSAYLLAIGCLGLPIRESDATLIKERSQRFVR